MQQLATYWKKEKEITQISFKHPSICKEVSDNDSMHITYEVNKYVEIKYELRVLIALPYFTTTYKTIVVATRGKLQQYYINASIAKWYLIC